MDLKNGPRRAAAPVARFLDVARDPENQPG